MLYLLEVNVLVPIAILLPLFAVYLMVLRLGYFAAVRFGQMTTAHLSRFEAILGNKACNKVAVYAHHGANDGTGH